MTLFLVQHGEAKPETEDSERSLTEKGTEIVERMADWAAQMGITVDEIRHSGKKRAEQTAMIFAKKLDTAKGVIAVKGLNPKMKSPRLPHRSRASRNRSCSSGIYLISAAWSVCW